MKTYLFGSALVVCVFSTAIATAQDVPCDCQSYPCCVEGYFNGWYVGGNVGVLSHQAVRNDTDGFLTDNSGWTTLDTSVMGGAQVGYDCQCGNRVFGVVADWNASDASHLLRDNPGVAPPNDDNAVQSDMDWFTTIRGRAGLSVHDTLVYVSAGPAVAGFDTVWRDDPDLFSYSDTRWGWAGSVGTEFACSRNISIGAELLYANFPDDDRSFPDGFGGTYTFGSNDSVWSGRILINYRFGR
jgi:outer membrane immunogenic protein